MLVLAAESDITASVCICVLVACTIFALFFLPRLDIVSPLAKTDVPIVPELATVGTRNVFNVKIVKSNLSSIKDGIKLLIQTSVKSELQCLWAVNCSSLQQALRADSTSLLRDAEECLAGDFLHCDSPVALSADSDTVYHFHLPDTITASQLQATMGPPPRAVYPLCLVIRSMSDHHMYSRTPANRPRQIVGVVYILHLKDDIFRDSSRVLSQLIVTATGQVCDLQKLYMASDSVRTSENTAFASADFISTPNKATPSAATPSAATPSAATDPNGCVVCHNEPVEIVLLPCRHGCICPACFPLINKCPMCRGFIDSYFHLHSSHPNCKKTQHDEIEKEPDWPSRFSNYCERLNQYLGFDS